MSQLAKAVLATDMDERCEFRRDMTPLFLDTVDVMEWTRDDPVDVGYLYRIEARMGAQCWVSEDVAANQAGDPLQLAIARTKSQVVEAVFGEFRQDFRMIERSIWNRDMETAGKLLNELERRMFSLE